MLFVVLASLALATVNRPPGGYHSVGAIIRALLYGAAAGGLILVGGSVLTRAMSGARVPQRHRPIALRISSFAALVLGIAVIGTGVAIFATEIRTSTTQRTANAALRLAFRRWQAETVPLVLSYANTIRSMAPAARAESPVGLRGRVLRDIGKLDELARTVAADARRYRRFPQLYALAPAFEQAIQLGRAAAADLAASLHDRARSASRMSARASQALLNRANAKLRRSQQDMQLFTFRANGLGGRLTAGS